MPEFKIIRPLAHVEGPGSFDTIFNEKYFRMNKAVKKNDFVQMDLVMDNIGIFYIQSHYSKEPQNKIRHKLIKQNFIMGLSDEDFKICYELAQTLLK